MRRSSLPIVAGLFVLGTATDALAVDHNMVISEVMLSHGGDNTHQYIELTDSVDQPFPATPYRLEIYDADAALLGSVELTNLGASTQMWWVATPGADGAFTANADTVLTGVSLPTDGQACFVRNSGSKVNCVAWGCINTLVTLATTRGASPPDGESLQRNSNQNSYFVGTPTPRMANLSGVPGDFCATDPDAGVAVIPDAAPIDSEPGTAPDANPAAGDDTGGGGCCRASGRGGAGGAIVLALATVGLIRRRATRR